MMPFMSNLQTDSQTFVERLLPRLSVKMGAGGTLRQFLLGLTVQPTLEEFRMTGEAFMEFADAVGKKADAQECALRCLYYASAMGCTRSAQVVGLKALALARDRRTPPDLRYDYAVAGLGWCLASFQESPWRPHFDSPRQAAWDYGLRLIEGIFEEHEFRRRETMTGLRDAMRDAIEEQETNEEPLVPDDSGLKAPERSVGAGVPSVIVISALGNVDIAGASHVNREFKSVLNVALPLVPVPDLAVVRATLTAEFPHAAEVTDHLLEPLIGRAYVALRPTILTGAPGSGKSTFAPRLLALLGVPSEVFPCGGVADSALIGSARRWSSSEPSFPVALVRRYRTASPGIVLDELDKASTNRHNGSLYDALLGLLEPQSAKAWLDSYLQASVNLSHIVWLATANSVTEIPAPLRDRCRVIAFPDPAAAHLPALAAHLLRAMVAERGLHPRWALPLSETELDVLRSAWSGGSIRGLARLVEGVLRARDHNAPRH
jgi:hypothetical protein